MHAGIPKKIYVPAAAVPHEKKNAIVSEEEVQDSACSMTRRLLHSIWLSKTNLQRAALDFDNDVSSDLTFETKGKPRRISTYEHEVQSILNLVEKHRQLSQARGQWSWRARKRHSPAAFAA